LGRSLEAYRNVYEGLAAPIKASEPPRHLNGSGSSAYDVGGVPVIPGPRSKMPSPADDPTVRLSLNGEPR
jgi:hypothetical protein